MDYELLLTAPGAGTRDVTELVQTVSWSGSDKQTARELSASWPSHGTGAWSRRRWWRARP